MTVSNAANINSTGVLISSTNLNTMELSEDQSTLSVGPGPRWGDVYIYLDETKSGKMVVGGRYAPVGIPGLLLGGGMAFFSGEYGFASTNGNVQAYEVNIPPNLIITKLTNISVSLRVGKLSKLLPRTSILTFTGRCEGVETLSVL